MATPRWIMKGKSISIFLEQASLINILNFSRLVCRTSTSASTELVTAESKWRRSRFSLSIERGLGSKQKQKVPITAKHDITMKKINAFV